MSKPLPTDARGSVLSIGDLVCYTTNSEGSRLAFGRVEKFYEKERPPRTGYNGQLIPGTVTYKLRMARTDAYGNAKFNTEFDRVLRQYVTTGTQSKSGIIEWETDKFLKL